MNKKILFSTLLVAVLLPTAFALAVDCSNNQTLSCYATNIEKTVIDIATPIVIIGWVIAGILYLTAAGKPEKLSIAKAAVIACVVGTVLVALAMGTTGIIEVIRNAFGIPAAPSSNNANSLYYCDNGVTCSTPGSICADGSVCQ